MDQRIKPWKVCPAAYKAMGTVHSYVSQCGLEKSLLELLNIRVSQINGCAYCLVMHTTDARKLGESDERMHLLNAWQEAPCFSARERAALSWVEAIKHLLKVTCLTTSTRRYAAILRKGDCRPDDASHRNQQLEPDRNRLPGDTEIYGREGCS